MDSCCAALKANAQPVIGKGNTGFWGESVKAGLKSRDFSSPLWKSLRSKKLNKKVTNPGVAYSVLTSGINKETMVST